MKTTTNLQNAGGISALIAAATYLFAMVLVFTILAPMADSSLSFEKYVEFYTAHKILIFIWHFAMYLINGVCLVILSLALYERLKSDAPTIMKIATVLGLIWASFVFLSGFIVLYGTEAFINLNGRNPIQAEILKKTIETITLGIDYSDRFLGCLWVGLVSIAALKKSTFPKMLNVFGIIISILGLIGTVIPRLTAISYVFGMGVIVWWLCLGVLMLRKESENNINDKN
jgi:Domain of unknown function (DUF4386)